MNENNQPKLGIQLFLDQFRDKTPPKLELLFHLHVEF